MRIKVEHFPGDAIPEGAFEDLLEFCKIAETEKKQPAHENMSTVDWQNRPETLLHTLHIQGRYNTGIGQFFFVRVDDKLAGVSGCYEYDVDPQVLVCGVRCWTLPEYRVKYLHGNHLFPAQFEWGKHNGYVAGMFTFNEYNLPLRNFLRRIASGRMTAPGLPNSDNYKDLQFPKEPVLIKNTKQWLAIKPFVTEEIEYEDSSILSN